MKNLLSRLHAERVAPDELELLLQDEFKSARSISNNEVQYGGAGDEFALRLKYSKKHRLLEIAAGLLLTEDHIRRIQERIERELLDTSALRIARVSLFLSMPMRGYLRYRDHFQIVPVSGDAPLPSVALAEHPAVLEFSFATTPSVMIRHRRRAVRAREWELLLNAFFIGHVRTLGHTAHWHWVIPDSWQQNDSQYLRSTWLQEMYTWPNQPSAEDETFLPLGDLAPISEVEAVAYYKRCGPDMSRPLDAPSTLPALLDRYIDLDPESRDRFLRACFWFWNAGEARRSRSETFIALISAVEALMPEIGEVCTDCKRPVVGGDPCPMCRRARTGQTAQFKRFVEEFGPELTNQERNKLYETRSKLSHGSKLLPSDEFVLGAVLTSRHMEEWEDISLARSVARAVLINWLCAQEHVQEEGAVART